MAERGGNGADASPPPHSSDPAPEEAHDLRARLDRLGDLLGKGLDLAEAGLSLGLTVASTLGAVAQQKIVEKVMDATMPEAAPQPPGDPMAPPPTPDHSANAAPSLGITNRLRLTPGMAVAVSFSVNNDNGAVPKQVALTISPFTGERTGSLLPLASLSVTPETASIEPMDFEKFVLRGVIPETMPPDTYHGGIAVESGATMRIPVWLVVEA